MFNLNSLATAMRSALATYFPSTVSDVVAGDSGQNASVVAGQRKEVAFTTTTVQAVASTDASNFGHVSVHVTSQGTSSLVTFQCSNDNANWVSMSLVASSSSQANSTVSVSTAGGAIYSGPLAGRYFRLNVTGISAGTTAGVVEFFGNSRPSTTLGVLVGGVASHGASVQGSPVRAASKALTTAADVTTGQTADDISTLTGAKIVKAFSIPEREWSYAAASGGIVNTSDNVLVASAGAGLKNYLTGLTLQNASATVSTEVVVKDGSTVIWRGYISSTAGQAADMVVTFPSPLKGTAATAMNIACITTSAAVYANAQGYQAP